MKTSDTQLKAQVREANSRAKEANRKAQEQSAKEAAEKERIKQEAQDASRRAEEAHRRALEQSTKASDEREQAKLKDAAQKHAKEMRRKDEAYCAEIARLQKIATDERNGRENAEFNWRVWRGKAQSLQGQLSNEQIKLSIAKYELSEHLDKAYSWLVRLVYALDAKNSLERECEELKALLYSRNGSSKSDAELSDDSDAELSDDSDAELSDDFDEA